jgi:hypothetical protein
LISKGDTYDGILALKIGNVTFNQFHPLMFKDRNFDRHQSELKEKFLFVVPVRDTDAFKRLASYFDISNARFNKNQK